MTKKLNILDFSNRAENLKLIEMENWLDEQLAKINSGTKEHELVFKHYNNINNIRTFYAQKLFDEEKNKKHNSLGFLGFTVNHKTEDPYKSVTADDIRKAIIKRLADLNDEDLISSVELDDTYEEGKL
jgi:hypothetical protein